MLLLRKLLLLFTIIFFQQNLLAQKAKVYNLVKDFGAKGDNKTDNYTAFSNAAAAISKAGAGVLVIPKGSYYIAPYKIIGGDKKNTTGDIIFKNCKGLIVEGNNSVIRVNGNFSRNKDFQLPNLPYFYAYNNSVCPFRLTGCSDVLIKDLELYGEVDKMKRQAGVVEGECSAIYLSDDDESPNVSSNVTFQNIYAHHFAADGIVIKTNGSNVTINGCRLTHNARQGLSIVKGKNFKCLYSSFDSTGVTGGTYGWHMPGGGIDVENEFGKGMLSDVLIRNCNLRGNLGFQVVTTLPSERVVIDSCFISDATGGYSIGENGVGMYSMNSTLSNCIIFASIQVDLADQIYTGPVFQEFKNNIVYSGHRGIISASFSRPCNITDNFLIMLPNPQLATYFPYIQNANCRFNGNVSVIHADRIKKDPNQVTALLQGTMEANNDFWLINGYNNVSKEQRKKNFFYIGLDGIKSLKNHFFPENEKIAAFIFPQRKWLTDVQVEKILSAPFMSAYKQNSFDRKYLVQAGEVRKYTGAIIAAVKN